MLHFLLCIVIESFQSFMNLPWQGQVDLFICVIPVDGEADTFCSPPTCCDFIILLEDLFYVFSIVSADIFDAKRQN